MVSRPQHVSVSGESGTSSVSCPCSVSCEGRRMEAAPAKSVHVVDVEVVS